MPILNLKISKELDNQEKGSIISSLTELTHTYLKKKKELMAITLTHIAQNNWFVNSESLETLKQHSFYLDIKVTDGTNSKDEKEAYIKAVFDLFESILDNIHTESYVYIEEVKADAYGYSGKTQEYRFIHSRLPRTN
ncbi:tautomerase family protein [Algoriphagus marincola]|uniref:tautomerase family protein n=1 Tax=Algoriphagus marincola TaxID=264027 RepID=UPI0004117797|nr:tautomerase family protein [Algoriphagus marincola]